MTIVAIEVESAASRSRDRAKEVDESMSVARKHLLKAKEQIKHSIYLNSHHCAPLLEPGLEADLLVAERIVEEAQKLTGHARAKARKIAEQGVF